MNSTEPTETGITVREQHFDNVVVLTPNERLSSNNCTTFERMMLDAIEPDIRISGFSSIFPIDDSIDGALAAVA